MVEFARRFEARGVRLAVVVLPHCVDRLREPLTDQKFIVERLHAANIPVLVPEFPRLPDGRLDPTRFLIRSDNIHPNREYNVLLASQLARFLAAEQLLQERGPAGS